MKYFKNKLRTGMLTSIAGIALVSCTKGFEEFNVSPDKPNSETASISGFFNGLSKSSATVSAGENVIPVAILYDMANQQAVQNLPATYTNYAGGLWNTYYPALISYRKLQNMIASIDGSETYSNVKNMAAILMASKTLKMLDAYGDIPYSKAGSATEGAASYRVSYDAQAEVYKSVLADLKAAADGIKTGDATQVNIGNYDSFLGNDYAAWIKFANALRLRYAVRLYNKEQALASEIINDIIGGNKPLPANQDLANLKKNNFGWWPGTLSPKLVHDADVNGLWLWYSFRELSVSRIRMSSNVWNQMSATTADDGSGIFDPRAYVWFMTNNAGKWVPQPQNHSSTDGGNPYPPSMIKPAIGADLENKFAAFNINLVSDADYPFLIISEADVYFLKAEIYQRGMGVSKNPTAAKTAYEAGVKSSVDFWYAFAGSSWASGATPTTPTAAQMTTLLTNSKVAYNGANDADALTKIATQAWLATIWEPFEAWAIVRRTGLTPKDASYTPGYNQIYKLPYPDDERVNNYANWKALTNDKTMDEQLKDKVYWMP